MNTPIEDLRTLLPVLREKEQQGLIKSRSHSTAESLIAWVDGGRALTDKQKGLVDLLLNRARRRHRSVRVDIAAVAAPAQRVDEDAIARRAAGLAAQQVAQQIGSERVDENRVADILLPKLMAEIDRRRPRQVEVVVKHYDGKLSKVRGSKHCKFEHLVRAATSRLPSGYAPGIFLAGEASSGKTTGARMLAEALKLDWHFNGAISFPHEMLGFIDGAGKYHTTPFRIAYEMGGVYTFDEVDRSDPVALLGVNPHLANGIATFPDGQVKRHKDCIIVCTANTWGLGADANYSGATKLDAAFLSRFPVRISWDIDPNLESEIVGNPEWLDRVRAAREKARQVGLKIMIDTRIAQAGAALIAGGYSMEEAAAMTYLANLKQDQRILLGAPQ